MSRSAVRDVPSRDNDGPGAAPQADPAARLAHLDRVAGTMDSLFRIPVLGIRVGADSIVGLVPGLGDAVTLLPAGYIVVQCAKLGAPRGLLFRMGANVAVDTVIGAIPLIGDLFDVGWKANLRNVALMRRHLEKSR